MSLILAQLPPSSSRPALPSGMARLDRTTGHGRAQRHAGLVLRRWPLFDVATAVKHGIAEHQAGADIVDVGGESTRPAPNSVPADEEQRGCSRS